MPIALRKCAGPCGREKPLTEEFFPKATSRGRPYFRGICNDCAKGRETAPGQDRDTQTTVARIKRLESDYDHLHPEDFDVSIGNDGKIDRNAAREKRQEFSRSMGQFSEALHESNGNPLAMPGELGSYMAKLAEQERRFGNRRLARSVSLAAAHEALALRQFKQACDTYLRGKITPTGYALRDHTKPIKRTVCALMSDWHLGAELSSLDNPLPFGALQEARRAEYYVRQVLDYKPQYRENSELLALLLGDIFDGMLQHDIRDGAPLTEQFIVFLRMFRQIAALFSQNFPKVRWVFQPGNHGRDVIRHPGRATSSKWDGHEFRAYYALMQMCSDLKNTTFDLPFRAVASVPLHGAWLLATHGDTEVRLRDPDTGAKENAHTLDRINSTRIYGHEYQVFVAGHFHKPRWQARSTHMLFNGALVPPNGWARTEGYIGEPCGQWLWEATEGFPVGDARFIGVDNADKDEKLGKLITPFRFGMEPL